MKRSDKLKLKKIVNEICCESCQSENKYCLLKEIIINSYQDPRILYQLKCVEIYKWDESKKEGKDIGWEEAHIRWVENGFAKRFADIYEKNYNENVKPIELYNIIINKLSS